MNRVNYYLMKSIPKRSIYVFVTCQTSAKGEFVMKYENLELNVLKRDKDTSEVKKRVLASLVANVMVKNNNHGRE